MYSLKNENVQISFDESGNLVEFMNLDSGINYGSGKPVWRLICQYRDNIELPALSTKPTIVLGENSIRMNYDSVETTEGIFDIKISIIVRLVDDDVLWKIEIKNDQEDVVVRESFFPMIVAAYENDDHSLLWPIHGGQKWNSLKSVIAQNHTAYMSQDEAGVVMSSMYPGVWLSMNFFMLSKEQAGLYLGSHDKTYQQTQHYLRLLKDDSIEAGFVKYPFVKPGEKYVQDDFVLSPYSGTWHIGADKYKKWIDSVTQVVVDRPEWLKDFNGWQRVIMKHQYGQRFFRYDQIEQIYKDGATAGVDGVFLFAWDAAGHDADYPIFEFDAAQGGKEAFKRNIDKARKNGAKIILYFNGHLIEKGGDFYNRIGHEICAKNERGLEYTEQYRFSGPGTLQKQFGNRIFVGACPACQQWYEHLESLCDLAIELEVDAIFFDQMGGWDGVLCWDESHGHPVPFTTIGQAKVDILHKLVEYVRQKAPGMGFCTEIFCDITAREVDFLHSLWGSTSVSNPDWEEKGEKPDSYGFIDLARYVMPDIILSDRDIRDDTDIPRRVNHALLKGILSDVEIYRCRSTIVSTPIYQKYLQQVNELREKYARFVLSGTYNDTLGFSIDNNDISARSFVNGNEMAVVLTQSHMETANTTLVVPGYDLAEYGGIGEFTVEMESSDVLINLNRHALVICVFKVHPVNA